MAQEDEVIFHFHKRRTTVKVLLQFVSASYDLILQLRLLVTFGLYRTGRQRVTAHATAVEDTFEAHRSPRKVTQGIFTGNLISNQSVITSVFKLVEIPDVLHIDTCSSKVGTPR